MKLTLEIPEEQLNEIKEKITKEVRAELTVEYAEEWIKNLDDSNVRRLLAIFGVTERYEKIMKRLNNPDPEAEAERKKWNNDPISVSDGLIISLRHLLYLK